MCFFYVSDFICVNVSYCIFFTVFRLKSVMPRIKATFHHTSHMLHYHPILDSLTNFLMKRKVKGMNKSRRSKRRFILCVVGKLLFFKL